MVLYGFGINGSIDGARSAVLPFSREAGEEDGAYCSERCIRRNAERALAVYGLSGSLECNGYGGDYQRCHLMTSGSSC